MSITIQAIWILAAQEAISVDFREIEPEHFLEALLRFAESSADAFPCHDLDSNAIDCLNREAGELKADLAKLSIDGTATRRAIRVQLGSGVYKHKGDIIHRSEQCRALFDNAAKSAAQTGEDVITCRVLLDAILSAPTQVIATVLNKNDGLDDHCSSKSLLARFGKPLSGDIESTNAPACKVLLQLLAKEEAKAIVLIADDEAVSMRVLNAAASTIQCKAVDRELWSTRFLVITPDGYDPVSEDILKGIFSEASTLPAVYLVLYPRMLGGSVDPVSGYPSAAIDSLAAHCIWIATRSQYSMWCERCARWSNFLRPIWCHEIGRTLPDQL